MKTISILFCVFFLNVNGFCQKLDTIYLKDGNKIPCIVKVNGDVDVEYYLNETQTEKKKIKTNLVSRVVLYKDVLEKQKAQSLLNNTVDYLGQDTIKYYYIMIVGTRKFLSTNVTIEIDYGQDRNFFSDQRLKDVKTGKPIVFNSMIDALNYFGNLGWEFVQAFAITTNDQNVYHFLMKKPRKLVIQGESK
ncbi:MAG TPA: hypothetical protein PKN41_11010 [Bacteroidales bacterium]|nr:hypothetical protein [Bacteroidales bacterium]